MTVNINRTVAKTEMASISYFRIVEKEASVVEQFERTTSRIPWLGKQFIAARLFILAVLVMAGVIWGIVATTRDTEQELLTNTVWCADTIMVGITRLQPNSFGIRQDLKRARVETFQLKKGGVAVLPGFNSDPVHAKWRSEDIYIEIYDADTFGNIYNGVYEFFLTPEFLKLQSEDRLICGSRNGQY